MLKLHINKMETFIQVVNNHLYKCFHVTSAYITRNSLRMTCKHRNTYERYKKQIIVTQYIMHLLDKYNKTYKMHDTYYNKFIWTRLE